ncbi:MAG: DEAD/DEAH box helicase [Candidatus Omnitrophica bacterium]|nr:DEAD/DEAH box helicase [Candidatus Omnitrophota bacterium]MDD5487843.1 DEAD/DEAH box helicase [Candidatus Omnitrophota bacterium]
MKYDPFQIEAINHINNGHSVLVSAPTGAGKTVIAEHVINDSLERGGKVIYTAPIKALSNQKFRDFQAHHADKTGILTGDVSLNPYAPVLIMTTEIFRNKILTNADELKDYSWVIFDEIHYLDNFERGTVWEECLIFLPSHMNMLGLSATIPNIDEFARWISSIHGKDLKVVKEEKRPVPLHFFYQCDGKVFDDMNKLRHLSPPHVRRHGYRRHGMPKHSLKDFRPNRLDTLVRHLEETRKLPCIYFVFGRKRSEFLAGELAGFDFLSAEEKEKISRLYRDLCEKFSLTGENSAEEMLPLVERGIAFHHAGMLPTLKEVIERLFTSRLIKVIFTTETFALGINMPARTVVFDELRKFYGRFHANLKTRDFYQMAGRAGRRGIDTEGFVYSRVNLNRLKPDELKRIILGEPERVRSRFNASYATILNLYTNYGDSLYDIYERSFHSFQEKIKYRERAVSTMRARVDLLEHMGYIARGGLTDKGAFASRLYGYELGLTELYHSGMMNDMGVKDIGIICSALVYEPRKNSTLPKLNKHTRSLQGMTDNIMKNIHRNEKKFGLQEPSKDYNYHTANCVEAWMSGCEFNDLLRLTDADEGEIIRYFRMAVQVLRELLDTPASPATKQKFRSVIGLINRDIVDAENQLKEL